MATQFFDEWRAADKLAAAAEKAVLTASLKAIDGDGPLPGGAEVSNAKRLRGIANDLFGAAMEEMTARAAQFKR
jgi:hypothetical protein